MTRGRPSFLQLTWRSRSRIARDIDAELGFHIDSRVSDLVSRGLSADEARRRAVEEFGDVEFTRRYCREVDERATRTERREDRWAAWGQDLRYAARTLRRSPAFAIVSLITLALAIGANTAIFSVARAVLLAPLPYGSPSQLIGIFESWPDRPDSRNPFSPANFVDYRAQQRSFTDIAGYVGAGSLTWRPASGEPEAIEAQSVAPNLFSVLQVPARYGRTFIAGDERPGNDLKVVVSDRFFRRALGGDARAIGRPLMLNGRGYELIGVLPTGVTLGWGEDMWIPLDLSDALKDAVRARRQHYVRVIGRLKPNVSMTAAEADMRVISRRLEAAYPEANTKRVAILQPLHEVLQGHLRPAVLLLQAAAAMVLLIACANLANLSLSRAMGRRREMALRAALGAGRGRLVRQLLTESVLLALVGGSLGVGLAVVATRTMLALNPRALPEMFTVSVDVRVLAFSVLLSIVAGVVFGLLPALAAARAQLNDALKEGGRGASGGRSGERVRRALVVAQVGLAVMLLVGAGLLVRSFGQLASVRLGLEPDHVLTAGVRAAGEKYDSAAAVNLLYDAIIDRLAREPGIVAAGAVGTLPTRGSVGTSVRIEGLPVDEKNLPELRYVSTRGDYFKATRVPIIAGRNYDASDRADGPKVAILNEAAARAYFTNGNAVGHRIRIGPDVNAAWMTVVGVVGDVRSEALDVPAPPTLFANHRQEAWESSLSIVVRTTGDPSRAESVLRRAVHDADPSLAVRDVRTLEDVLGESLAPRRLALGLASSFAIVALLLAAVGIYGVLAYNVATRTREFGVRMALGATPREVSLMVLRDGLVWSVLGLVIGVIGALAGGRLLASMLYGVTPVDATTYLVVIVGLLAVACVASLVPAARATRVDPLSSMRAE